MHVLITCKNEENPIQNEGAKDTTTLYSDFSDLIVSGGIWTKFELIQAFINVLLTGKNEEDLIKKKLLE